MPSYLVLSIIFSYVSGHFTTKILHLNWFQKLAKTFSHSAKCVLDTTFKLDESKSVFGAAL